MCVSSKYRFQNVLFNPIFYPVENLEAFDNVYFSCFIMFHICVGYNI